MRARKVWGEGPESPPPNPHGCIRREGTSEGPQRRVDRRLEEGAKAVGGGYCRLQMPLKLALAVRGQWLGVGWVPSTEGGGTPPPHASLPTPRPCPAQTISPSAQVEGITSSGRSFLRTVEAVAPDAQRAAREGALEEWVHGSRRQRATSRRSLAKATSFLRCF